MTTTTDDPGRPQVAPEPGSIADIYREVLPALDFEAEQTKIDVAITVAPDDVHRIIATSLRDDRLSLKLLRNLTAVDWQDEGIEVVYHLYSVEHRHSVCIKTRLRDGRTSVRSITDLHMGADWAEREAREMFGIEFDGHPDPRNLLLDEDLDIHPLLKSYPLAEIELPQGVDVEFFTKEHPPAPKESAEDAAQAARIAAAKKKVADGEKKSDADLTPEELAAKKAAQAERVKAARELAAARRAEGPKTPMGEKAAAAPQAAATAAVAETPATPKRAASAAGSDSPKKATADMTPEELEERQQAQAERVKRGRELAAARRAELRGDG
jgi:NADH-quinone oxidoreductase subunit C